ncbi:hypothetical protein ASPZODRAFT_306030 [Penicilliopsis zonata CBS 506.65]|uniref:Mitochondrial ATPase expression-domain-containing protein n=1 Tax=Penicilliopsis zonata CBS 506.65 TaxID=1073090 RepID=A0A1L9SV63_9EURO|nr:hypothetical protein ASPZODRAFT_306030 [Penicilliopsis zonata CBS 506.65]OJJ51001.1 hypothetical protein ASPZODRAFT_306030 [Penicilliopsis zonata CBS 506.65]
MRGFLLAGEGRRSPLACVRRRGSSDSGCSARGWPATRPLGAFLKSQYAPSVPTGSPQLSSPSVLEGGGGKEEQQETEKEKENDAGLKARFFYKIIRGGQPDQIIHTLADPRYAELVGSLSQVAFVEVLHLLSPTYFIDPYREIHRPLHPTAVQVKNCRSLESIFDEFATKLANIVLARRRAGHVLGLAEYTHLLDCARSMGDADMAEVVWQDMQEDGVLPDIRCYNLHMEAKVWDTSYTGREKYRLRMTPYAFRKRRVVFEEANGWQGYGTATRSVRRDVMGLFNQMTMSGNEPDETTFATVILASGRVGHVAGVKSVLRHVWNIDMDTLAEDKGTTSQPPVTPYDRTSPLHPTGRLLFAVAHAFGTNNDISAALQTIGFISRAYNITVPDAVWLELFERAWVLSRPRFGPDAARNAKGQVSSEFLTAVYQTMTADPYNVRPTIEVYHALAKTAWDQSRLAEFQGYMDLAYEAFRETRQQRKTARTILERYLNTLAESSSEALGGLREFADAVNTYHLLRLRTVQHELTIERLARLLLIHDRWMGRDNVAWEHQLLPRLLETWRDFLPESVTYATRGGVVKFRGRTFWGDANIRAHRMVPIKRVVEDAGPQEERYLDDAYVWARYRERMPTLFNREPFNRVTERVTEGVTERFEPESTDGLVPLLA